MKKFKTGFTLAEVLITLAIIGVVAALTIPTLITKMSERAANARKETIEARLLDGINRYSAMDDGLSQKYDTTYDFLVGLSKYYKMSQICRANEITNCVPYDKIYSSVNEDSVDVSTLTSVDKFLSGNAINDYLPPASFITAQGTPVIMAFKKDCAWDMGKAMRSIEDSGCIAYMYDESGTKLPNKLGKDWVQHGLTVNGLPVAVLGGVKIMTSAFAPSNTLSLTECQEEAAKKSEYQAINSEVFIDSCEDLSSYGGDAWAYAMKYCKELGYHIPTEQQLLDIANSLYTGMSAGVDDNLGTWRYGTNNAVIGSNEPLPAALEGLTSTYNTIWSSEFDSFYAYDRDFRAAKLRRGHWYRYDSGIRAICVKD